MKRPDLALTCQAFVKRGYRLHTDTYVDFIHHF